MKEPKDHYVPKFYLKRWSQNNPDQKLFSFRFFPDTKKVHWTPRSPSGTGYERALYGEIEETFFKPLDDDASRILNKLESDDIVRPLKLDLGEKDHNNWAIFILGLIIRVPDKIKHIHDSYENSGVPANIAKKEIPNIIENKSAVKDLRSLTWLFARVETNLELITCDNPVIFRPNNLSHPDCSIILPMGPKHFFLATRGENIQRFEKNHRKMVTNINIEIIKNANKRIYASRKHSVKDNFIIKHLEKKTAPNKKVQ